MTDPTTAVRDEDAFDVEAVASWLRDHTDRDLGGTPDVRQFPGGASNLTYLLTWPDGTDLILRRPPAGVKAASAHDMGREYRIQSALAPVFPLVPEMVGHCEDEDVIGSPFYVMTRAEGVIPRRELGVFKVSGHKPFTGLCEEFAALSPQRFRNEKRIGMFMVKRSRMKLDEFHVVDFGPGPVPHRDAVTRGYCGIGCMKVNFPKPAGAKKYFPGEEQFDFTRNQVKRNGARASALMLNLGHYQINGYVIFINENPISGERSGYQCPFDLFSGQIG